MKQSRGSGIPITCLLENEKGENPEILTTDVGLQSPLFLKEIVSPF